MIQYRIATIDDINLFMQIRLEMLKVVNDITPDYRFSPDFVDNSRAYFENSDQTTVLAFADETVIGCATICYINRMVNILIDEAKQRSVTEISLDATQVGRALYQKCGFVDSEECMVLNLK